MDKFMDYIFRVSTQTCILNIVNFARKERLSAVDLIQNYYFEFGFVDNPFKEGFQVDLQWKARKRPEPLELTESMRDDAAYIQQLIDSVHEG